MTVDLSDYCRKFNELSEESDNDIIEYDEYQRRCSDISIIDINENARLYITNADITRNRGQETVSVTINGYLFEKASAK